jgi:protein-disulfide isomerase
MKFLSSKTALMLSAAGLMFVPAAANAFTEAEKAELGEVIRDYILENPALILEAVEKHREAETAKAEEKTQDYLKDNYEALAGKGLPSVGPEDADVTIVEFMDYNCGYCKRALPDITKLLDEDKSVRFVFHEMPVLGPTSHTAALWALAAHKQDKYFEYHAALMDHKGSKTEKELEKLGEQVGLDVAKLKEDAKSEAVNKELMTGMEIARSLGLQGTPAFIVGDQVFRGYIGHEGLVQAIKSAREEG